MGVSVYFCQKDALWKVHIYNVSLFLKNSILVLQVDSTGLEAQQ